MCTFTTDPGIGPTPVVREFESHGFDTLWVTEHTHVPASHRTPAPEGIELGDPWICCRRPDFCSVWDGWSRGEVTNHGINPKIPVEFDEEPLTPTAVTFQVTHHGGTSAVGGRVLQVVDTSAMLTSPGAGH